MTNLYHVHVVYALPDDFYADSLNDLVCDDVNEVGNHILDIANQLATYDEKDYVVGKYYKVKEDSDAILEHAVDLMLDGKCKVRVIAEPVYN